ncbi:hypothetical protein AAFC00_006933 [Neodothiora populina]|uniref:Scavenger mRNA decapping enzyme n=1 Tax=Neodothiora populina TaxID=2781224 RepID=A0ABR3PBR5_9PEZI
MAETTKMTEAEALVTRFQFERLLNQDQAGRRIVLKGSIDGQPAILLAERAAFQSESSYLHTLPTSLAHIRNLGDNDVYRWYLACTKSSSSSSAASADNSSNDEGNDASSSGPPPPADLKINLIYPCTDKHIKKYTAQAVRLVTETASIYASYVRPYMQSQRDEGRLNWVYNIIEGRTEQEDVLFRSPAESTPADERFLLLPDLNWDRETLGALHLLALVERRDIWSARDLRKAHVPWLRHMMAGLADQVVRLYDGKIERDMLKFYVHYQPTYYHFHIHIVHVGLEAGATQAVGKALSLDNIISQLATMKGADDNDQSVGLDAVDLTYAVSEGSDLWTEIFLPLKEGRTPTVGGSN